MVIDQSLGQTRAERMIGCEVRRLQEGATDGRVVYGAFRGDELIAEAAHLTDDLALQVLVRKSMRFIRSKRSSGMAGDVRDAAGLGGCRFITADTGPMEALIDLRIWSRCVGTVTS